MIDLVRVVCDLHMVYHVPITVYWYMVHGMCT
jgi:hypothetical protein